jgi:hypothetical protein
LAFVIELVVAVWRGTINDVSLDKLLASESDLKSVYHPQQLFTQQPITLKPANDPNSKYF